MQCSMSTYVCRVYYILYTYDVLVHTMYSIASRIYYIHTTVQTGFSQKEILWEMKILVVTYQYIIVKRSNSHHFFCSARISDFASEQDLLKPDMANTMYYYAVVAYIRMNERRSTIREVMGIFPKALVSFIIDPQLNYVSIVDSQVVNT